MEHYFELPVTYQGAEVSFNGRLVTFGYSYKFYIVVKGEELVFEKDDEGDYRVLSSSGGQLPVDAGLMESIITSLKALEI